MDVAISSSDYSLVRQTSVRKLWVLNRTCICSTFHPLLNKLTISQWMWCFCNQVCYHITSFYIRVQLRCNLKKKKLLRRHFFQFCCLPLQNIPWCALNLQHVFAYNDFSNGNPWNQTQFPCKLSSAILVVLAKKYSSVHFFIELSSFNHNFSFLGLCFPGRWQEVGWVVMAVVGSTHQAAQCAVRAVLIEVTCLTLCRS